MSFSRIKPVVNSLDLVCILSNFKSTFLFVINKSAFMRLVQMSDIYHFRLASSLIESPSSNIIHVNWFIFKIFKIKFVLLKSRVRCHPFAIKIRCDVQQLMGEVSFSGIGFAWGVQHDYT